MLPASGCGSSQLGEEKPTVDCESVTTNIAGNDELIATCLLRLGEFAIGAGQLV
jgi:hypothetical protein